MTVEPAYKVCRFNGCWFNLIFTVMTEQATEYQKRKEMKQEISCYKKSISMTDKTNSYQQMD